MKLYRLALLAALTMISALASAQVTFHKEYGSTNPQIVRTVAETDDGGLMFAGTYKTAGSGTWVAFIHRADVHGNILWSKAFQGDEDQSIFDVEKTLDGHYMATGRATSFSAGEHDVFLIKFNESGEILWSNMYGGPGQDWLNTRLLATADSGFVISASTTSYGAGSIDAYLVKTNAIGDTLWTRTIGGDSFDYSSQVIELDNGDLVMAGFTASYGPDNYNYLLTKMNAMGDTLWTKVHGFDGNIEQNLYGVVEADNGDLIAVGRGSQASVMRTDSMGNLIWHKHYGGPARFTDVRDEGDGSYIVSGSGGGSIFFMKMDEMGNVIWSKRLGNTDFQTLQRNYAMSDGRSLIMTRKNQWPDDNSVLMMVDSAGMMACDATDFPFSLSDIPLLSTAGLELGRGAVISPASFSVFDYDWVKTVYCTTECLIAAEVTGSDLLCNGDGTGMAEVAVTQAYGTPDFTWTSGDSTAQVTGLTAGWQYVEVVDSLGCTVQDSILLSQPDALTIEAIIEPQSNSANGSISLTISGGTAPYESVWSNGMSGLELFDLEADTFIVTLSDDNLCTLMAEYIVADSTDTTSLIDWDDIELSIYPNPTADVLYIELDSRYAAIRLSVYDIEGRRIDQIEFVDTERITLPVSHYASGDYLIELLTAGRRYSAGLIRIH